MENQSTLNKVKYFINCGVNLLATLVYDCQVEQAFISSVQIVSFVITGAFAAG